MSKLLSIIIPTFNMEKYLDRCLSSLVVGSKHLSLFEALIINDGSTDRSSEIGHKYHDQYPDTFFVIDKENHHYGSCINRGLMEATGTFVKVLDSDDLFDKDVFVKFLDYLASPEVSEHADIILSDYTDVDKDLRPIHTLCYSHYSGPVSLNSITDYDLLEWSMPGICYRTSILVDSHYQQLEGTPYTDLEWTFTPVAYAQVLYRFEGSLYWYVRGREGQSVEDKVHAKNLDKEVQVVEHLIVNFCLIADKINPINQSFLNKRLYLLGTHLYQYYLLSFRRYITNQKRLIEFDEFTLNHYPSLHSEYERYTTRIAGIPFHLIKDWRSRKILYHIELNLYKIADLKNRLLAK